MERLEVCEGDSGQWPASEGEENGDIPVGSPGISGAAVEPELDEVLVARGLWRYRRRGGCLYEGVTLGS